MDRKNFIKINATAGAGLILGSKMIDDILSTDYKKIKTFGIQLYTLRDILEKDTGNILKQLASYGYKQIESYEGPKGMFWGFGAAGFRKRMDDLGMILVSSHCEISKDFEKKVADAASVGMNYLICPWKGPQKSIDEFKKFADEFNIKGKLCKEHGIKFAYHNHDYSFKQMEGQFPQDIMMNNTDPSLVDFQMDIFWVVSAGQDPIQWLNKYPGRFKLCHIKDRSKNPVADNNKNSVDLGEGLIDFNTILKTASKKGMEYYFVEQEAYPNGSPLKAAKADALYMRRMKI